jgi:V/A-type H+-transporting ATPase subunit C
MAGFDYGNARLRAMKSRLLTKRDVEALINSGSVRGVITVLTQTDYQRFIESALTRSIGLDCIDEALNKNLINTVKRIKNFYQDNAGDEVALVLRSYDIHNLKVILRGLTANVALSEILEATLPVGELDVAILNELASAAGSRACVDMLASMGFVYAQPLMKLRGKHPGALTSEMELELDRWQVDNAYKTVSNFPGNGDVLLSAYRIMADLVNLNTVLRFSHAPSERKFLRDWLGKEGLEQLFIGPGILSFSMLARAGNQDTVNAAVDCLKGSPYDKALAASLASYAHSARLSDFEKQLIHYRLGWMSEQITKDPLGIGVVLGYLALKTTEIGNIRWIAKGIDMGLSMFTLRSEVILIP